MDLALNIIVSILLLVIIILFIIFSKRIAVFNSSKKELAKFLEDFQGAIMRAERNINELKAMGDNVDENLKSQIKKARFLANDLSFLTEKGETVANQLDNKISQSRESARKTSMQQQNNQGQNVKQGIQNLTRPNKAASSEPASANSGNKNQMSPTKKQALDALLKQIAKKKSDIS